MGILKRLRSKKSEKHGGSKVVRHVKTQPTESSSSEDVTVSPLSIGTKEKAKKVTFGDVVRIGSRLGSRTSSTSSRPIIETQDTDNLDQFFSELMQDAKVPKTTTSLSQHSSNPSRISAVLSNDSSETFSTYANSNNDESSVETCKSDSSLQYLYRYLTCQPRPEKQDVEGELMRMRDDDSLAFTVCSSATNQFSENRKNIDFNSEGSEFSTCHGPSIAETEDAHGVSHKTRKGSERNTREEPILFSFMNKVFGCPANYSETKLLEQGEASISVGKPVHRRSKT
jgi:hypothetical protein